VSFPKARWDTRVDPYLPYYSFSARYATFSWLENDDKTRRFLGIEIGQGYDAVSLHSLSATSSMLALTFFSPHRR
jgi:hypothetical protein